MTNEPKPDFYTVKELADRLRVTETTVRRMVSRGQLACHSIGRAKRFRREDVEAFLSGCRILRKEDGHGEAAK